MSEILSSRGELTVVTPMMHQYLDVKSNYSDYVLMYRLGDFFECFFEDAVTASRVLELTLTARDCGGGKRAAMCGVPFHKADVSSVSLWNAAIRLPSASRWRTLRRRRASCGARLCVSSRPVRLPMTPA